MNAYFKSEVRYHKVFMLLLVLLLYPATGFSLDNDRWNTGLGFQFYPPGARALGMGGAFVGLADDATAAASNPAGIAQLTHMQLAIEGRYTGKDSTTNTFPFSLGAPNNAYQTDSSSTDDVAGVTFGAFTTPLFDNFLNVSLFYDKPMSFSSTKNSVRGFSGFAPIVSYPSTTDISIDEAGLSIAKSFLDGKVMIGLGVGVQFFDFKQHELWIQPGAFDISASQTDEGVSYRAGVLVKPMDSLRLGISYTYMPSFDYTIQQRNLTTNTITPIGTAFDVPDNLSFGAAYNIFPNWVALFELRYVMYSQLMKKFAVSTIYPGSVEISTPSQYRMNDVMEIHFGTEYVLNAIPNFPIPLRAGGYFEPAHDIKYTGLNEVETNMFNGGSDLWHGTVGAGVVLFNHVQFDVGADLTEEGQNVAASLVYQF